LAQGQAPFFATPLPSFPSSAYIFKMTAADAATAFAMARKDDLSKDGMLLFRELLRVFPTADVADYFKNGVWNKNLIKLDTEVIGVHKQEAGADAPPPLSEIKEPVLIGYPNGWVPQQHQMPTMPAGIPLGLNAAAAAALAQQKAMMMPKAQLLRPAMPVGSGTAMAGAQLPKAVGVPTGKAAMQIVQPKAGATGATPALSQADVEGRMIAGFSAKWKMEPQSVKEALEAVSPVKRRWVIANFQNNNPIGRAPIDVFQDFIGQCEQTNAWAAATAPTAGASMLGVKRPLSPGMPGVLEPAAKKFITAGSPIGVRPVGMVATPGYVNNASVATPGYVNNASVASKPAGLAMQGAVRPVFAQNNAPGMVRPPNMLGQAKGGLMRPPAGGAVRPLMPGMPRPMLNTRPVYQQ